MLGKTIWNGPASYKLGQSVSSQILSNQKLEKSANDRSKYQNSNPMKHILPQIYAEIHCKIQVNFTHCYHMKKTCIFPGNIFY